MCIASKGSGFFARPVVTCCTLLLCRNRKWHPVYEFPKGKNVTGNWCLTTVKDRNAQIFLLGGSAYYDECRGRLGASANEKSMTYKRKISLLAVVFRCREPWLRCWYLCSWCWILQRFRWPLRSHHRRLPRRIQKDWQASSKGMGRCQLSRQLGS